MPAESPDKPFNASRGSCFDYSSYIQLCLAPPSVFLLKMIRRSGKAQQASATRPNACTEIVPCFLPCRSYGMVNDDVLLFKPPIDQEFLDKQAAAEKAAKEKAKKNKL